MEEKHSLIHTHAHAHTHTHTHTEPPSSIQPQKKNTKKQFQVSKDILIKPDRWEK